MNETILRTRAQIGNLKLLAGGILLGVLISGAMEVDQLIAAMKNPGAPQSVQLEQLVNGTIDSERYIAVSGYAMYDVGYDKTMDGQKIDVFYALLDNKSGSLILVEAPTVHAVEAQNGYVTLTGMTRNTPAELKTEIQKDIPSFKEKGVVTTSEIYLAEGQRPPDASGTLTTVLILGAIAGLCLIPFFFPSLIFVPMPVELTSTQFQSTDKKSGVKVIGRFVQLTRLEPTIQAGTHTQRFNKAIANIIPLETRAILIYIRHIVKTKLHGVVTIHTQETHWGVFVTGNSVIDIEAGKLYSWEDRWAVRLRLRGRADKPDTLYVSFDRAATQAEFVQLLKQMGFPVNSGAVV